MKKIIFVTAVTVFRFFTTKCLSPSFASLPPCLHRLFCVFLPASQGSSSAFWYPSPHRFRFEIRRLFLLSQMIKYVRITNIGLNLCNKQYYKIINGTVIFPKIYVIQNLIKLWQMADMLSQSVHYSIFNIAQFDQHWLHYLHRIF